MKPILAHLVLDYFEQGGLLMGPMAAGLVTALYVVIDRSVWWWSLTRRSSPEKLDHVFAAMADGDFEGASRMSEHAADPLLATVHCGLSNGHAAPAGAMHRHAVKEIEQAEARLWILGTLITLAPLLGLLGTVTGIMGTFRFLGQAELAAPRVSGGIAEALIATASGLAIAILCLIPYNYFHRRLARFKSALEWVVNHTESLLESARRDGHEIGHFSRPRSARASRSES